MTGQLTLHNATHIEQFSGRFCAAARALLEWPQDRLAAEAGVARKTISDFELSLRQPYARTKRDLLATLDQHGVRFSVSLEGCSLTLQERAQLVDDASTQNVAGPST